MNFHEPVLKEEVLSFLNPLPGKKFIDATLGDGGHTLLFLEKGALVLGIDCHQGSLDRATKRISEEMPRFSQKWGKDWTGFTPALGNFRNLENIATEKGFCGVWGIVFDLGFSSTELDEQLGLSFLQDQPLDMRLDKSLGVTAEDLVNSLSEESLVRIFFEYGGERYAKSFAHAIVKSRGLKRLQTTKQLAELIESIAPLGYERGRIHPATRVFQALRIVVNDEIENLRSALPQAARLLLPGGRMAVISFHSLEDKVVKSFGHSAQPVLGGDMPTVKAITPKPVTPSLEEKAGNVRSRSAKLRVFERI